MEEEEALHSRADNPCSLWRTRTGAGEKCEEEGAAKRSCYGLTRTSSSPSPCAAHGRGGQESEVKE